MSALKGVAWREQAPRLPTVCLSCLRQPRRRRWRAGFPWLSASSPSPVPRGKGSSVPAMWLDSGIPFLGLGSGGVLPALVPGVREFGEPGKEVTHGKRDGRKSSQTGGQVRARSAFVSIRQCHGPAPGSWEAARAGAGGMGGAPERSALPCQGQAGWQGTDRSSSLRITRAWSPPSTQELAR